jgi:SAM-dependent methyltransferase
MAEEGSLFAASRGVTSVEFVTGFGEELPFRDNYFDAITSVDVFEHVEDLEKVLRECWRVLKTGGTVYGVFPPFYQLLGGSHLHGYISKSPGPNLIFSNRVLLEAINAIVAERNDGYRPNALRPKDKLPGMNGTTIKGFKKILRGIPFSHTRVRLDPLFSPYREQWESLHMRYYGFLSRPLVHLPWVREAFTGRIACELTK